MWAAPYPFKEDGHPVATKRAVHRLQKKDNIMAQTNKLSPLCVINYKRRDTMLFDESVIDLLIPANIN